MALAAPIRCLPGAVFVGITGHMLYNFARLFEAIENNIIINRKLLNIISKRREGTKMSGTSRNVLADLVSITLIRGDSTLDEKQKTAFHKEFEEQIREPVEQIRTEKRRSYDKSQDLAFW